MCSLHKNILSDVKVKIEGGREANYILAKTARNHLFSFGGLSGSRVKNKKGEVIGIFTGETSKTEVDPKSYDHSTDSFAIKEPIFDQVLITPMELLRDLQNLMEKAN